MKPKKIAKTRRLYVVVTPEEYSRLQTEFHKTTYRFFPQYIRALLRRKPVTVNYRNASLDGFLPAAHRIKNELEEIRKRFTQAIGTLKTIPAADLDQTIHFLLAEELMLQHAMEEIRLTMIKICEKCME